MNRLTNQLMKKEHLPEKIIQFGEGNFLRCFTDWMIQQLNKSGLFRGSIVAIQPTPHGRILPVLEEQDYLYTVVLRGVENGEVVDSKEVISAISRGINPYKEWSKVLELAESNDLEFVFSNTTEAGISYVQEDYYKQKAPLSFPGKLTAFLYHRFQVFGGCSDSGLVVIPCELIDHNGDELKRIVQRIAGDWNLPPAFLNWIDQDNMFLNTLVDRIVTGYPKDDSEYYQDVLGYSDHLITVGEPYHMFAIDADSSLQTRLPFHRAGLNVKWGDIRPHREIKVRLLNGPHTMMFSVAYLCGIDHVKRAMEDALLRSFIDSGIKEIYQTVDANEEEKNRFVEAVTERFLNPFNKHYFVDIGMNSFFKFKTRLLPVLKRYVEKFDQLPTNIVFSLASLLIYYKPIRREEKALVGYLHGKEYEMREDPLIMGRVFDLWTESSKGQRTVSQFVSSILADDSMWGENLNEIPDLTIRVTEYLEMIVADGANESLRNILSVKQ
ncbi:tagaturonate reductase [Radiobacillus kanasensis]|uniref:tagaturonate reductase n=1 Tax=Radiobacillus kanasensis TaxID=2844358 RepID=UPI001E3FAE01|nr:tagaturonate reductase [Radiobacillus kanasensis]UFU01431.1 tagaturonate reductase [Radiobacillus kanasensis]